MWRSIGPQKKNAEKLECPAGKRNGVGFMDVGGWLLVNRGEVGVVVTMIIVAVPE